jgi:hypothetical protein
MICSCEKRIPPDRAMTSDKAKGKIFFFTNSNHHPASFSF